ncbi:hypothetical protein Nepgr_015495 [Nepenthes gracilis]|uniref:K Homology domain-containing protein n=1 Tax=Nepenthes gracilis TaxID=150966 RepID=A0AAD3SMX1_NEPGR|nr:hypothetical protein Nepgr_015495 [Nepenthes gracilis]
MHGSSRIDKEMHVALRVQQHNVHYFAASKTRYLVGFSLYSIHMSLTPSKRSFNQSVKESKGKRLHKFQGFNSQKQPIKSFSGSTVFRVLCPASKIDGLIEKGETVISQIQQETGAKVSFDETVPGCDERVIFIMAPDKEAEIDNDQSKNIEENSDAAEEQDDADKRGERDEDKESLAEDSQSKKGVSALQKALLLVFETFFIREQEVEGVIDETNESSTVSLRLLVLSSQVGCILGKGGSVIKQMTSESGARIRVLPRDKRPACASSVDEVVQITGSLDAVKNAIKSVSKQIMENEPRDQNSLPANPPAPSSHPFSHSGPRSEAHNFRGEPFGAGSRDGIDYHHSRPSIFPEFRDNFLRNRMNISPEILTFRLLCPDERVGGVIGKGGAIIKMLQHDTGCEIKVLDSIPDVEDRIILISGPVHPDERVSAVQDAVLLVQAQIAKALPDLKEKGVIARLLVSSNQIGCLLGKGGAIIAEMRKVTGAYIRILGKDQIPKCAPENEEVVQVTGELEVVQEAVLQITTRLRHHFFRDAFPSMNLPLDPIFPDQGASLPSFRGRRELSPLGMFHNLGPSFRQFDSVGGLRPHGGFHPSDDRPPFMHDAHRSGIPHIPERPWGPQNSIEGGPMGSLDYTGGPQRRIAGFRGGSQPAIITNTTVEVVVPSSIVPAIYGEDGGCLKQIRQISDAKITVTDPKPGSTETVIIISGTPEQTHAAQSLIQAFVISEAESS